MKNIHESRLVHLQHQALSWKIAQFFFSPNYPTRMSRMTFLLGLFGVTVYLRNSAVQHSKAERLYLRHPSVPHWQNPHLSPQYDVLDHTNHVFSVRIWSWQHVIIIISSYYDLIILRSSYHHIIIKQKRPNICYIFQKWGTQNVWILYSGPSFSSYSHMIIIILSLLIIVS